MPRLPTNHRRFLRDLALILGLPAVLVTGLVMWWKPWEGPEPWEPPPGVDVFEIVAGSWGWAGNPETSCSADPHQIRFSEDRSTMMIRSRDPWTDVHGVEHEEAVYDIVEVEPNRIRGIIRGESRRTVSGDPVVWDLVLMDSNTYRWHRTDWFTGSYTGTVERCDRDPDAGLPAAPLQGDSGPPPDPAVSRTPNSAPCPDGVRAREVLDWSVGYPAIGGDTVFPEDSVHTQPYWRGPVSYDPVERPADAPRSGRAIMRFVVNPDGVVPACLVTIVEASDAYAAQEARAVLANARYVPGQRGGRAVWTRIQDTVHFRAGPPGSP